MKLIQYLFCVIFLGGSVEIPTENPCSIMYPREGNIAWGKGAYLLPDIIDIPVYRDIKGTVFGSLRDGISYHELLDEEGHILPYERGNMEYIGSFNYELLKVKPTSSESYVKIYEHRKEGALYAMKKDLQAEGVKYYTYQELLLSKLFPFNKDDYDGFIRLE